MELWRQCAHWLIQCRVLPPNHRVTWDGAQVCELAQALRDGVLLCQLLNNLLPHAVNLREINLRPQMSQFLCLKNIRTFLSACCEKFGLHRSQLFEVFDLFDVQDFGKVIYTLSALSWTTIAQNKGIMPFPTNDDNLGDDDIYSGLSDQIDDTVEEDEELYDCVENEEEEGDEIYEDLMRTEPTPMLPKMTELDKRICCLREIQQTEEKYTDTLSSIQQHFLKPLQRFLRSEDIEIIFINLEDLLSVHSNFLRDLKEALSASGAPDLYQVFINYKERFLVYGRYCSQVESASKHLDRVASMREDVQMKLEECSQRANNGRFTLRDLLMVPMQRVLKYHLLLQGDGCHNNFSFYGLEWFRATEGTFYQGYRCHRCRAPAHKECLGRVPPCGRHSSDHGTTMRKHKSNRLAQDKRKNELGLPKMEVCQEYYGLPPPPVAFGPFLRLNPGDIVELTKAEAEQNWWQGRNTATNETGWFPCKKVKPYVHGPPQDLSVHLWYAGPMERAEAENILTDRSDGTFLVRQRVKDSAEFAISIKFNVEVKHIKITTGEGLYRITEKKAFRGLVELVEFYRQNSLKDCFKSLDLTLQFPFKEPERRAIARAPAAGSTRYFGSAKARYDFCARDRTELSLKEGDIIKIISKKGHQGWWRGEIYGRIGWFPSNYVEEDYSEYC
ncbi:proto-oncogene vav [Petaurus breviceps papuanus]|uniref:proto-oncogene vav n=1 Tax=Petaurus breviceps papuanus TaxID=3040969 RepID=UPI0036DBCAED